MGKSTTPEKSSKPAKPPKPYADFPLFPHATRRWAKKIRGKLVYFGAWNDPHAALAKYLDQKDDLHAGRTPRQRGGDGLTIRHLLNRFLSEKEDAVAVGELTGRTFHDYRAACARVARILGGAGQVEGLTPENFASLKRELGKTLSPASLRTELTRIRSIFRFAFESALLDKPVRYGPGFKSPSRKVIARARRSNGPKMFPAEEIRLMLDNTTPTFKGMLHLAINCGFGNHDCATLTFREIDLHAAWHGHARPGTQIERRAPLWPETVQAVRESIAERPAPKDPSHRERVFLTTYGHPWARMQGSVWSDSITKVMHKLLVKLGLKRSGASFCALRRTFQTIAEEVRDPPAVRFLMGHGPPESDVSDVYRQRIDDSRLVAVVAHIHEWLFPEGEVE